MAIKEPSESITRPVWYLYIIRCKKGALYTGITTDVPRRLKDHQENRGAKYLRGKGPLKLVFSIKIGGESEASKMERKIKSLSKEKKELLVSFSPFTLPSF